MPAGRWHNQIADLGDGSIVSNCQSTSPTDASENRPSSGGGVNLARATVIFDARSGPNQGLARAPLAGLRVVATRSAGLVTRSDASKRGPFEAMPAHPQSASAEAADVNPRSTQRREATYPNERASEWLTCLPFNSRLR